MRGWKKVRVLLLAVCLAALLCVNAAAVTDPILWTSEDGLYTLKLMENSDGGLSVTGWSTEETTLGDLVIPAEVNGVPVTRISYGAFQYCNRFTGDLIIADSVTEIGERAFFQCDSLTGELHLPANLVSVGETAFYRAKNLKGGLQFSEQIQLIGEEAFEGCSGLDGELRLPEAVAETLKIEKDAFRDCANLKTPAGQEFVIPEGTTDLESAAFYGCSSLSGGLILPQSLTTWGGSVFFGCSALNGRLVIPDHVTAIPGASFYGCSGLTGSLRIPDGVTDIGMNAFRGCSGFTGTLKLPQGLTILNEGAFYNCSGLTGSLKIPSSVTLIGRDVFSQCSGFTGNLNLPDQLMGIASGAFYGCSGLSGVLRFPDSATCIEYRAFYGCSGFEGLILPDAPVYFGDEAFKNCSAMTGALIIPEGTDTIRHNVFENCSGFTSLTLPDSVTFIGVSAFANCSGLTGELILPSNLTDLCGSAFENCSGLTGDLILPQGLEEVGNEAFYKCSGLDGMIKIPYSVRRIGSFSFTDCSNVREIYLPPNVEIWDRDRPPFYKCRSINAVYVGGGENDRYPSLSTISKSLVHYNSYPAKELDIYGGGHLSYRVGQTVTLEATYAADEIAEDLSFSWSSSHPEVVKLIDSSVEIRGKGYAAKVTATFEILKESSSEITVTGPFSLKDECVVIGDDSKELIFIPKNDQSTVNPNVMQPGDTMEILFSYRSYSPVAEDLDDFVWKTLVDGEEQSGIVGVSNTQVSADGEFAATLTATVTALDYGGPVEIQVSGPRDCKASCTVVVPEDKLTILDGKQKEPEELLHLRQKVTEPFTLYVKFETRLEDAQAEQAIENLVWSASTPSFFGSKANEHNISTDPVFTPVVTWEKVEDGVYLLQTELTPALEGVTALKIESRDEENDIVSDDICLVYAVFDVDSYLAELYEREAYGERLPEAQMLDRYLYELDAPSELIKEYLENKNGFIGHVAAWEALDVMYNALDNPAAAVMEYQVREQDIYYALILELLRGTMEEYTDLPALQTAAYGTAACNGLKDAVLMLSQVDLTDSKAFSSWMRDNRNLLDNQLFEDKMDIPGVIGDFLSVVDVISGTLNDYGQAMANAAVLEQVTGGMERMLEAMLAECPANAEALREALEQCLKEVQMTYEQLRDDAELGLILSSGKRGYQAVFDKLWDTLTDRVKWSCPQVLAIQVAYAGSSTFCREVLNTDDSVETYFKMLALEDIREVAVRAADTLSVVWNADPGGDTAAAYMGAVDMLYRLRREDLELAQEFAQVLIDSPAFDVIDNPAKMEAALASFKEYGDSLDGYYLAFRQMWMGSFHQDYPNGLLDLQYEDLFADVTGMRPVRVVVIACPVNVRVLDRKGQEAAYIGEDRISCTAEDLAVMRSGEEKHILFYGSGYTLQIEGYDEGTMDVTERLFDSKGRQTREIRYEELPVEAGADYRMANTGNLRSDSGSFVKPDSDSADYAFTLKVQNGILELDGLPAVTAEVTEGRQITIRAREELDGRPFRGWESNVGTEIFADPASPVTTLRMPADDVDITAVFGQPKPDFAGPMELTDDEGNVPDTIPADSFTVTVPVPEETVQGLLAGYDGAGMLVWIGEPETATEGLHRFRVDNTEGKICELRFFALTDGGAPAQHRVDFPERTE